MANICKLIEYRGYDIEITYDEFAESPNDWGNTDCFIVYDHRDFRVNVDGFDANDVFECWKSGKALYDGKYWMFPVYAYIHSGVSLSLGQNGYPYNDRWDTSFKGFALVKRQVGWYKREHARRAAQSVIETWNTYLSGNVFAYQTKFGSCSGYYDLDQAESEAKSEIDNAIIEKINAHLVQLKNWIVNRVGLSYRKPLNVLQ